MLDTISNVCSLLLLGRDSTKSEIGAYIVDLCVGHFLWIHPIRTLLAFQMKQGGWFSSLYRR